MQWAPCEPGGAVRRLGCSPSAANAPRPRHNARRLPANTGATSFDGTWDPQWGLADAASIARHKLAMRNNLSLAVLVLYRVEPRVLMQAVKRNRERFPDDFMFQLTKAEFDDLKSQNVISSLRQWGGRRY